MLKRSKFSYTYGVGYTMPSQEETFSEIKHFFESKPEIDPIEALSPADIYHEIDPVIKNGDTRAKICEIGASLVSVSLFACTTYMFQCSGLIIGWDKIKSEATILTSARLVHNPNEYLYAPALNLIVRLGDGSLLLAKQDTVDFYHNLLIVKVQSEKELKAIELQDEEDINISEGINVISLGRNFFDRAIEQSCGKLQKSYPYFGCEDLWRSSCEINEVSEGGPLITYSGNIVGINFFDGHACAHPLPTSVIGACLSKWRSERTVVRPWVGVTFVDSEQLPLRVWEKLQIPLNETSVVVKKVCKGSPADKSGVRPGDFVVFCADQKIVSAKQLSELLGQFSYKWKGKRCITVGFEKTKEMDTVEIEAELVEVNDKKFYFSWPLDSRWYGEPR